MNAFNGFYLGLLLARVRHYAYSSLGIDLITSHCLVGDGLVLRDRLDLCALSAGFSWMAAANGRVI